MVKSVLIKNGTILTMDENDSVVEGDLFVRGASIVSVGPGVDSADEVIDASGCAVVPGFVQTHIHLCQTLFRGAADDLPLIDWLKNRVWPMEAAHNPQSVRASAELGIAEMIKGGTTCALTMETVNHTEEAFRVAERSGFRATIGKCMMDKGEGVPPQLHENAQDSIRESLALLKEWHGRGQGRLRYCFAPRFAVSCTPQLLSEVSSLARSHSVMIHTHASENRTEIEMVERETGMRNIIYLDSLGLTGADVALAHCVHLDDAEVETLRRTNTQVLHCPSSNLKLGSGIARVSELLERGVNVSLGADGAPCNNRLDMFTEMRTAALLQKVLNDTTSLPARRALRMATIDGARALQLDNEIGSLEAGKRADISIINLRKLHASPGSSDIASMIVYAAEASDVETVLIDGTIVMRERELLTLNERDVVEDSNREAALLMERAGLA